MMAARRRITRAVAGLLLLGAFPAAGLLYGHWGPNAPSVCAFRACTGRPCIFCGLTRALACAARADFAGAFGFHAFWPVAAGIIALAAGILLTDGIFARNAWGRCMGGVRRLRWVLLALVVVLSVVRAVAAG